MIVKFKQYQFDLERLVLTENGTAIPLNEKSTKILSLLLSAPDQIHSKAEILERVWSDRVVTDQVVFQNINLLRNLLGNEAIKTFTKKGYQWQIPLEFVSKPKNQIGPQDKSEVEEIPQKTPGMANGKRFAVIACILCIVLTGLLLSFNAPSPSTSRVSDANNNQFAGVSEQLIVTMESLDLDHVVVTTDERFNQQAFDSPFQMWSEAGYQTTDLMLAHKSYITKNGYVLRFQIQGAERGWEGYVEGQSIESNIRQLTNLIRKLSSSNYFTVTADRHALAELTLLQNNSATTSLLEIQQIKHQFQSENFDFANAMADSLLSKSHSILHRGIVLSLKTRIAMATESWDSAALSVNAASNIFDELNIPHLQARVLIEKAWVLFVTEGTRGSMEALNTAANKARIANEPLIEVNAHLIQSFMASKSDQFELRHAKLDLAKQLIELHALHEEHQITLLNYTTWGLESVDDALPYYWAILNKPIYKQYEQEYYIAAEKLRKIYIAKEDWKNANRTIQSWQAEAFQHMALAEILYAQGSEQESSQEAQVAFTKGQISYRKKEALDAALLILLIQQKQNQGVQSEYIDYIKHNASKRWLRQNRAKLNGLSGVEI